MTLLLFFLVSLLASTAGAACGIGGGILIKPVLDALALADAAAASFLSGCTVLVMSGYNTARTVAAKERSVEWAIVLPLALGAAAGGAAGKQLFQGMAGDLLAAKWLQNICLATLTAGTLLYLLCKKRVKTHTFRHPALSAAVGGALGLVSAFLGIGGGPVNLAALSYFFGMDTKTAAQSSLAVIFFSQAAALALSLASHSVPALRLETLALMALGGLLGGEAGRWLRQKRSLAAMDRLLAALMVIIICTCVYSCFAV